jgi:hypothetical protein
MITEVEMKRELFGRDIKQRSKSEFLSATDLVKAGNIWRVTNGLELFRLTSWLARKSTKEFISEIEGEYGKAIIRAKGKGHDTWLHPFLFIDLALAINPKLKVEVYKWLYDALLKHRNSSGDSYKKMNGALFINSKNKSHYYRDISVYANKIKEVCKVEDWQRANEKQLELRNKIHNNITLLCDVLKNNDDAVRIGIKKALEDVNG